MSLSDNPMQGAGGRGFDTPPESQAAEPPSSTPARKLAEAELAEALAIGPDDTRDPEVWRARLRRLEAAARLDPTWDEPAYQRIVALVRLALISLRAPDLDTCLHLVDAAEDFLRRFPEAAQQRGRLYDHARVGVAVAFPNLRLNQPNARDVPHVLDDRRVRIVQAAQRLADHAFENTPERLSQDYTEMMINVIYRGMRLRGIPVDQREAWLGATLQRCSERIEAVRKTGTYGDVEGVSEDFQRLHTRAAALAAEDGRRERAVALLIGLQARVEAGERLQAVVHDRMREAWKALDDAEAVETFDRWLQEHAAREVVPLEIVWPTVQVVERGVVQERDRGQVRFADPPVHITTIPYRPAGTTARVAHAFRPARPLTEGDGRLYVLLDERERQMVGYVALDAKGRPVVGSGLADQTPGGELLNSLRVLPAPPAVPDVQDARYLHGKLYLAAGRSGILIFDTKTETWTHHAMGNPLPGKAVDTIFPLGEHKLFCVDGRPPDALCYVLDLQEARATHQQRLADVRPNRVPRGLWRRGDALLGFSTAGLVEGLPGDDLRLTLFPSRGRYGWPRYPHRHVLDMVEVGARRFFTDADGLHEFDHDGGMVQTWYGPKHDSPGTEAGRWRNPSMHFPADSPAWAGPQVRAAAANEKIYFLEPSHPGSVLALEPSSDTWYGPLRLEGGLGGYTTLFATRGFLWTDGSTGLHHLDVSLFHRRAQETGRVMTTAEFRLRRDAIIQSQPELERAKLALAMYKLDEAKGLLDTLLAIAPDRPEALLLSAYLYEHWCLDQPDEAIRFYRRLADVEADRAARLAGLLGWSSALARRQEWQAAEEVCTRILKEYPRLSRDAEREVRHRQSYVRGKMEESPEP